MPIDEWKKYLGDGPFDLVALAANLLCWMQDHGVREVEGHADDDRIVFDVVTFAGERAVLSSTTESARQKLRMLRARFAFLANAQDNTGSISLGDSAFTLRLASERFTLVNDAVTRAAVG